MPDQVIEFEGIQHHFPDDFSHQDIQKALNLAHPKPVPVGEQPFSPFGTAETMLGQVGRGVGAAADWLNPLNLVSLIAHPYESTVGASARSLDAAGEARRHGDYGEMALHGLGALPVVGPPGESILRDIGQGNIPELLGHAAAAYLMKKAPGVAPNAVSATRSIGSGMIDQVKAEAPQIHKWGKAGGIAGAVLGGDPTALLHEGGTGYAVGAGARALPALARGAREGYRNRPSAFEPVMPSEQSGVPTVGRFDVNQYGPAPSRVPPVEVGGGHVPDYTPPSTVDLSSPSSMIPPVQTSAPAAAPSPGMHAVEVPWPPHYANEPNAAAAHINDLAVAPELMRRYPEVTQGTLTPDMVHEVRKALGQRRLKEADIERRVQHIRHMLPK
jgi:hypothetical protein